MTVQNEFTTEKLLEVLQNTRRPVLQAMAQQAQLKAKTQAVAALVQACETLAQRNIP